jgi:ubiquinone/menaquinone biosynthesis C-methylase UbiE
MFSNPQNVLSKMHIDPGMVVADFGCGAGHYSLVASPIVGPSGKVFAFDIQKDLLGRLKNIADSDNIQNIQCVWSDLDEPNSTKLRTQSVDRVLMTNVLFQVEDKKAMIREAKRILKSNGKVLVVDWEDSFGGLGPSKANVLTQEIMVQLFQEEGFKLEKEIDAGEHHYGLIFGLI